MKDAKGKSKISRPRKERSSKAKEPANPVEIPAEKSIFVRIPGKSWKALTDATETYNKTQADVIGLLLNAFGEMPDEDQTRIMDGGEVAPLNRLEDLIAHLQAANHSFSLKRWIRSIEDHERVLATPLSSQLIKNWAKYRLAYIWIDIAYDRRAESLRIASDHARPIDESCDQLDLAVAALEKSLSLASTVGQPMKTISIFNEACVHSLLGQYRMERAILAGDIQGVDANFLDEKKSSLISLRNYKPALDVFHQLIRSKPSAPLCEFVKRDAANAMTALDKLYFSKTDTLSGNLRAPAEHADIHLSWLLESCKDDSDLMFVQENSVFKERFEDYLRSLRDRGDEVSAWCRRKLELPKIQPN